MMKPLALVCLLAGLFIISGGVSAQKEPAAGTRRLVYVVRHGTASELAAVLGKHFKGEAEVQALADGPSNFLLISAAPGVFGEVVKTLEQLDRPPRSVAVEVLLAEVISGKEEAGQPAAAKGLDEPALSGSIEKVLAQLNALRAQRRLGTLKRVQLIATENQLASARVGESKPHVVAINQSMAKGGLPRPIRTLNYKETGTQVQVQLRVSPEGLVGVELTVEDTQTRVPLDGIPLGVDETGVPIRATEFITSRLKTTLNLRSGHAVLAKGVQTTSKSGQERTLVIVTARVVEPGPAAAGKP
ncbi:MAG: hypothetical protein L0Z62_05770 [Gemmataceae bacterium]|nr:hypothetical protein [Gemmataceae bacterium]